MKPPKAAVIIPTVWKPVRLKSVSISLPLRTLDRFIKRSGKIAWAIPMQKKNAAIAKPSANFQTFSPLCSDIPVEYRGLGLLSVVVPEKSRFQ